MAREGMSSLMFGVLNVVAAEANSTPCPFPSLIMSVKNTPLPLVKLGQIGFLCHSIKCWGHKLHCLEASLTEDSQRPPCLGAL